MTTHPEQTATEFYAGNIAAARFAEILATCPSARLGSVAYGLDGEKLSTSEGLLPLIIGNIDRERYNELMMTRTFGPHWRQLR